MKIRKIATAMLLAASVTGASAEVCKFAPGSVTCGSGQVDSLMGNGTVRVHETKVNGATLVNGLLNADDSSFLSLQVNGTATLTQCTINENANIKGIVNASSSEFKRGLDIYSNLTRLTTSNVLGNLHIHHTSEKQQTVYLDNHSTVHGDIIFDDGNGKVIVRGSSNIIGKVIGGVVTKG